MYDTFSEMQTWPPHEGWCKHDLHVWVVANTTSTCRSVQDSGVEVKKIIKALSTKQSTGAIVSSRFRPPPLFFLR